MEPTRETQKGVQPQMDFLFIRGMDSFTDPTFIADRQYRSAFNVVNRGGVVQCRPGYRPVATLPAGRIQGLTYFTPTGGRTHLVAAVDGKIYVSRAPFTAFTELSGISFRKGVRNVYFADCQKAVDRNTTDGTLTAIDPYRVLVMQDGGYSRAAYWDGSTARHLDPSETGARQTPSGGPMKQSGDRLWVARGPQLFASDIADPLSFDENVYLAEGQPLLFPSDITALAEVTSGTVSYLLVFTENEGHLVQSSIRDRTKWKTTEHFQFQMSPAGCVGHRAIANQYGLLWWYSSGGLMSLDSSSLINVSSQLHYRDIEMAVSKANLSKFLSRVALTSVENFLLVSVPSGDAYNRHTWVLDQAAGDLAVSDAPPAWAGIWTGTRPVEWASGVIDGRLRAFFVSRDFDGENRVWEAFQPNQLDGTRRIKWSFTSKAHAGDGANPSEFRYSELYLTQLRGTVDLSVSYAGPYRGAWKNLLTTQFRAAQGGISPLLSGVPTTAWRNARAQSRTLRTPEGATDRGVTTPEGETAENVDFSHQIRVQGEGPGGVRGYKIYTKPFNQSATGQPATDEATAFSVDVLGSSSVSIGSVAGSSAAPGGGFFACPMELRAEDSAYRSV